MTQQTKTALVTGASRGIGAAIAKRLAADGFNIVVNYAGSTDKANQVVKEIQASGGNAVAMQADVSDAGQATALVTRTIEQFGAIDVLVNNAGVMTLTAIAELTDDEIHQQIDTNLKGVMYTTRQAVQKLRENGRIINLSTSVVGLKLENYSVYAATKAGVEAFSAITAKELRGKNITVNSVAPGPTETALFMEGKSDELVNKLKNMPPLERLAQPDDIASVVSFLCSSDGAWVNGQVLRANGGIV